VAVGFVLGGVRRLEVTRGREIPQCAKNGLSSNVAFGPMSSIGGDVPNPAPQSCTSGPVTLEEA